MKKTQYPVKSLVCATIVAMMSNQISYAGAFGLYTESSAVAIGNYAAGIAAEASDASTAWYNPAGLVLLKKQEAVLSGVGVFPSSKLTGTSSYTTPDYPPAYVQSFSGLQGAEDAGVPAFHYALPLGERAAFGFSVVVPFGLSTYWGTTSPVRYAATRTQLHTVDVSPDIAGKLTDNLSFGAGIDVQWAEVKFNAILGAPAALQYGQQVGHLLVTPTTWDSTSNNQGTSIGVGFHTGLMGSFNDNHTRVGLNYQSKIAHQFHGKSTLTGPLADPLLLTDPTAIFISDGLSSNTINLPDVLTLSMYQDVNAKLALLGSVVYTGWSSFKTIQLKNIAAYSAVEDDHVLVNSTATENYRNAWRVALGANYHVTDRWMMRIGGGYDQTPTVDSARDVRLPDVNRWALSIGAHYQLRPSLGLDLGYSYLFALNDSVVNKVQAIGAVSTDYINATAKVHAQLIGAQLVWTIV